MQVVIDLNDIDVFVDAGKQQVHSPGFALLQRDQEPALGGPALHQSRLAPAHTANRFWRDLSLNPAGINHPQVRHQADLVWHHIKQINAEVSLDQALFLCPSHYTEEQLSLLSGILKAQEITPVALMKRALAAALFDSSATYYLEFQLHQVLLTSLMTEGGELIAADTRALAGDGYIGAADLLLKAVQKRFIRETRFDPLHHASTEQQLADALPETLDQLGRGDTTFVSVQTKDDEYRAEVHREELAQALEPMWKEIQAALPAGAKVLVDKLLSRFPGFRALDLKTSLVSVEDLTGAARELPPFDRQADSPVFLTRARLSAGTLPPEEHQKPETPVSAKKAAASAIPKVQTSQASSSAATHLLCGGVAQRNVLMWLGVSGNGRLEIVENEPKQVLARCIVTADGLEIEAIGDIQVNGEKLVGKRLLQVADHLSAVEFSGGATAIQVVGDAG